MSGIGSNFTELDQRRTLEASLRDLGLLTVQCSIGGEILQRPEKGSWWLADLLCGAPIFANMLERVVARWDGCAAPKETEVMRGLWAIAQPIVLRRQVTGYSVTIVPTEELPESEQLVALCSGAGMDTELLRSRIRDLPPVSRNDLPRLVSLVSALLESSDDASRGSESLDTISRELAESYEEISLLYTMIQSMTSVDHPERFITIACEELLATLSYRWVGALLIDDPEHLKRLSGRFIFAGEFPVAVPAAQALCAQILDMTKPEAPMVLQPLTATGDEAYRALGNSVLVHPITGGGRVLGVLLAGDKLGKDTAASSADMKLLGATSSHTAIFMDNAKLYDDLNGMLLGTLEALSASIDAKDPYTCGHSRRVALLTQQLATAIGLDQQVVRRCQITGLVHDVGKIGVPEAVLTKPGRLTDEEFAWIQKHPEIGHRILKDIPKFDDILPGVLHHHERWDGNGYPAGLAGSDIPLVARLIALADTFDAMSSTRTYRAGMSREEVREEIKRCSGSQFDPDLVPSFLALDFTGYDAMVTADREGFDSLGEAA